MDTCTVNITKTGTIYVNVTSVLTGKMAGSGDLYYRGDIEPNVNVSGTGQIIKLE